MKKSLIALAVASTFVAPAAMADTSNVTVYGSANMAVEVVRNGDATAPVANGSSTTQISGAGSALGFKGSEDLGGGTSAIFQIETGVALDGTPGQTWATNDSFVGLKGDSWGTVLLGQHDTPYKMAFRGMDLFDTTIADNRSIMGGMTSWGGIMDNRLGNVIAYVSPAMSGFTAAVAYIANAEAANVSSQVKGSVWSLAGMYGAGPINAALAYQVVDAGTPGTATSATGTPTPIGLMAVNDKLKAWKLGGGYTMDAFQVNLAYERLTYSNAVPASDTTQTNWYLSGKFNVSASDAVKAAYTHAGNPSMTPAITNGDAKQYSIGYDHNMSKRTTLYALYTRLVNNSSAASNAGYTLFTGDGVTSVTGGPGGNGANPSAFSLGMKHSF